MGKFSIIGELRTKRIIYLCELNASFLKYASFMKGPLFICGKADFVSAVVTTVVWFGFN